MVLRYGILILTAVAILMYGILKPHRNWDMVAYVAAAYHKDGYRGADLNRVTYEDVKKTVSDRRFSLLTTGEYSGTVFKDPASLAQQIPFYSIRVAYVELIRWLGKTGLSYARSTFVISACFAALSVLMLGLIISRTPVPMPMLPVIVAVTGYTDLARLSTPDAMACFFSLVGIHSLMAKGRVVFLVAAILPLIRTDFILLSGLLMGYAYVQGKRLFALLSLLIAAGFYFLVTTLNGSYGYLTLFNFSLIGSPTPYPADLVISTRPGDYLAPYWALFKSLAFYSHSVIYLVALYLFWLRGGGSWKGRPDFMACLRCLLFLPPCTWLCFRRITIVSSLSPLR
ncbi:MAG: hypothetical protein ABI167_11205 [Nitrosospira sp.]